MSHGFSRARGKKVRWFVDTFHPLLHDTETVHRQTPTQTRSDITEVFRPSMLVTGQT
jgi:hypothetical protein